MTKNAVCVYGDSVFWRAGLPNSCAERAQVHCTIVVLLHNPRLEESNCNLSA